MEKETKAWSSDYISDEEIRRHIRIFEEEGSSRKIISKEQLKYAEKNYRGAIGPESGQYTVSESRYWENNENIWWDQEN